MVHMVMVSGFIRTAIALSVYSASTRGAVSAPTPVVNASSLIEAAGYPCEDHLVTTDDGFILHASRMPQRDNENAPVVILQHGLIDSAATWVQLSPKDGGLPYMLHDAVRVEAQVALLTV